MGTIVVCYCLPAPANIATLLTLICEISCGMLIYLSEYMRTLLPGKFYYLFQALSVSVFFIFNCLAFVCSCSWITFAVSFTQLRNASEIVLFVAL